MPGTKEILDDFPRRVNPSPFRRVPGLPPAQPAPADDGRPQTDDLIRGTWIGHPAQED